MAGDRRRSDQPPVPPQIRAARALLGWSRMDLARVTGLSPSTIKSLEKGQRDVKASTLMKLSRAFECHGVRFIRDHALVGVARQLESLVTDEGEQPEDRAVAKSATAHCKAPEIPPTPSRRWFSALPLRKKA
jgi:transcriptional regulator with XRE-family HTH domain